jgi:hypothetical protein
MQTFMPEFHFPNSVRILDNKRLGKQRVETMQIMMGLHFGGFSSNHPASIMWRGYECALMRYQYFTVQAWKRLGFQDTCLEKTFRIHDHHCPGVIPMPWWRGDKDFHRSHQSNLIRKDPERYQPMWPTVPDDLPYLWPTETEGEFRLT